MNETKFQIIVLEGENNYSSWIGDDYLLYQENKRNKIFYSNQSKTYFKMFKKPLKANHSDFLYKLFKLPWFRRKFTPHLITLILLKGNLEHIADNDEVKDDDILRIVGYITKAGTTLTKKELRNYLQNKQIRNLWKKAMTKYRFHYNDFKTSNLIRTEQSKIGLIDLEAIRSIDHMQDPKNYPENIRNKIAKKVKLFRLQWYYDHLYRLKEDTAKIS